MTRTITGDYVITGGLFAGNWAQGRTYIAEPSPAAVTQIEVTGLNLRGSGAVRPKVTAHSTLPWLDVQEVTITVPTVNGFGICLYQLTANPVWIHWMVFRA